MIREAEFLGWALATANNVEADQQKEYLRYIRNAGGLVISSGVAQTIAFMQGKGGTHARIATDLQGAPGMPPNLLNSLSDANARDYIGYTRSIRRAIQYLKRATDMAIDARGEDPEEEAP